MEIYRYLINSLREHLKAKEITLITGARQVGKTTLMLQLQKELYSQGEKTIFLNLDYLKDKEYFSSQEKFIKKIELEAPQGKIYIFIDEIQRIQDAGIFLKGIYDKQLNWKLIVSGSGSIELKEKIHESLTGRKRIFEITPVSFTEFVDFKTDYRYKDNLFEFLYMEKNTVKHLLSEYLNYGGYPRIIIEGNSQNKFHLMNEIFTSYIEKDITGLLNLQYPNLFSKLISLLAGNVGYPVNLNRLSADVGISQPTLKKYIWYIEKTYVIKSFTPFHTNLRKELTKANSIYFNDIGFRNLAAGIYGFADETEVARLVFQNFIAMQLYGIFVDKNYSLHYWRTTDKAEVDILLNTRREIIPFEIKYGSTNRKIVQRSLRSFISKYNPSKAYVINWDFEDSVDVNGTEVIFLPFYKIYFEIINPPKSGTLED